MAGQLESSSGQRQSADVLCALLRECSNGEDPEVVRGVLKHVFDKLPKPLRDRELEEVLYGEDLCYVSVLASVSKQDLREAGMSVGAVRQRKCCRLYLTVRLLRTL